MPAFPISIVTDEVSQDLDECAAFLHEHGLATVELRRAGGRRVPDLRAADRRMLRRWVDGGEIHVLAVSPGTFKHDVDDRGSTARELGETLPRAIDVACELGATFVITFAFDDPQGRGAGREVVDSLRAAARLCGDAGLTLLLENEPGFIAETAEDCLALVAAVGDPAFGLNWDPANSNDFAPADMGRGLRAIFPHVRHVHVKNGRLEPGERFARWCALGDGDIDWGTHLALLAELGYAGHLGIETHFAPLAESSALVLAELRALLADLA